MPENRVSRSPCVFDAAATKWRTARYEATLDTVEFIEAAARLDFRWLYPMPETEAEEPIIQPGRIEVLLDQRQAGQVLRSLSLTVFRSNT